MKNCVIKRKLKFEDYKNCLGSSQRKKKIINLYSNTFWVKDLVKNHKEFIKDNKLILKTQQRFKSERHNVFAE